MSDRQKTLAELPEDVRAIVESVTALLTTYMRGTTELEMMVGRNMKAKLTFTGGPITREAIEDTLAHLAFYKKYFPKPGEPDAHLDSADKILEALAATWKLHREELAKLSPSNGESAQCTE